MPSGVGLNFSWSRRLVSIASMRDGIDDRTRDRMCLCARMLAWKPPAATVNVVGVNAALDAPWPLANFQIMTGTTEILPGFFVLTTRSDKPGHAR